MIEAMLGGLGVLFSPAGFGLLVAGVVAGLIFGAVPGISGITALTIFLPLILNLDPSIALLLFIGVGASVHTADTIPAVLFSVPGTGAAMTTLVDGYPMAQRGEGARALGAAYTASMIGGLVGAAFLLATIPVVRPLVLLLGSPELFMVALMGISVVGVLSGRRPLIGLALGLLGLLLGQIGLHPQTGSYRWSFDSAYMVLGLPLLPAILGLFGFAEMADLAVKQAPVIQKMEQFGKGLMLGVKDALRHWSLVLRSSIVGLWVGIVPGVGAGAATWVAYGQAVQTCKDPDACFGKGDVRGVIAPEAANNASLGGDLLPTLAFGVPGSTSMVLYMAAFTVLGIVPGPDLFRDHLDLIFALGWGIAVGNVLAAFACVALSTQIVKVSRLSTRIFVPIIMVFIFIGAMMATSSMMDLYTMLFFGAIGFVLKRLDWPRPPLVLGFVLGTVIERYLFISSRLYGVAWLLRPGVIIIGVLIIASIVYGMFGRKTTREEHPTIKPKWELAAILVLIGVFTFGVLSSWGWKAGPKAYAWVVAIPGLVFVCMSLIQWLLTKRKVSGEKPSESEISSRRVVVFLSWMLAWMFTTYLFGFIISAVLFVFFYLKLNRVRWLLSTGLAASVALLVWGLFDQFFQVTLIRGVVPLWLGLF